MKKLKITVVTAALAIGVAACGTTAESGKKESSSSSSSSATSSPSNSTTPSSTSSSPSSSSSSSSTSSGSASSSGASGGSSSASSDTGSSSSESGKATLPSGTKLVTAPTAGLSFAVPSGWKKIDASLLDNPAAKKNVEQMAQKSGMTADQLIERFQSSADLVVVDLSGKSAFAENANVTKAELPAKPTQTEADAQFKTIGATPLGYRTIQTSLGEGAQETYTMQTGAQKVYGVSMFVPSGSGSYRNITVSSTDKASAEAIAKDIAASLRKS